MTTTKPYKQNKKVRNTQPRVPFYIQHDKIQGQTLSHEYIIINKIRRRFIIFLVLRLHPQPLARQLLLFPWPYLSSMLFWLTAHFLRTLAIYSLSRIHMYIGTNKSLYHIIYLYMFYARDQ